MTEGSDTEINRFFFFFAFLFNVLVINQSFMVLLLIAGKWKWKCDRNRKSILGNLEINLDYKTHSHVMELWETFCNHGV